MEFQFIVGVDMSKEWFDFCLLDRRFNSLSQGRVENTKQAILQFIAQILAQLGQSGMDKVVLCMEHTGVYVKHLAKTWMQQGGRLSLVHARKVSQQMAGQAGWVEKTDQLDAQRLAHYGIRFSDQLELWQAKGITLERLQAYQRQRERIIKVIKLLEAPLKESRVFDEDEVYQDLLKNQAQSIKVLKEDLKSLERNLNRLIEQDEQLAPLFKLVCSVEGIGPVTARELLIATQCFTRFESNQGKAFARYAGVIPLKRQSGKRLRKKERIPSQANKTIKSLLTMGATALIGTQSELGHYYRRKLQEGKDHLCVINAIRNKIILRVFAVVRNQVMYQKNLNLCLHKP